MGQSVRRCTKSSFPSPMAPWVPMYLVPGGARRLQPEHPRNVHYMYGCNPLLGPISLQPEGLWLWLGTCWIETITQVRARPSGVRGNTIKFSKCGEMADFASRSSSRRKDKFILPESNDPQGANVSRPWPSQEASARAPSKWPFYRH